MTTTGGRFWRRIISVAITACLGAWFVTLDLQAQAGAAILGAVSDS